MEFSFVGGATLQAMAVAAVVEAVTQSGEDLTAREMENTPVDTGTLRGSEHPEVTVTGTGASVTVSTGGESSEYAFYVHQGTSKMAGRPYAAQALMDNAPVYVEAIKRAAASAF